MGDVLIDFEDNDEEAGTEKFIIGVTVDTRRSEQYKSDISYIQVQLGVGEHYSEVVCLDLRLGTSGSVAASLFRGMADKIESGPS